MNEPIDLSAPPLVGFDPDEPPMLALLDRLGIHTLEDLRAWLNDEEANERAGLGPGVRLADLNGI